VIFLSFGVFFPELMLIQGQKPLYTQRAGNFYFHPRLSLTTNKRKRRRDVNRRYHQIISENRIQVIDQKKEIYRLSFLFQFEERSAVYFFAMRNHMFFNKSNLINSQIELPCDNVTIFIGYIGRN